jgi:hypothetical protein
MTVNPCTKNAGEVFFWIAAQVGPQFHVKPLQKVPDRPICQMHPAAHFLPLLAVVR